MLRISSKVAEPFCISTSEDESSCCLTFLPAFSVVCVPDFGCSEGCLVDLCHFSLAELHDLTCDSPQWDLWRISADPGTRSSEQRGLSPLCIDVHQAAFSEGVSWPT